MSGAKKLRVERARLRLQLVLGIAALSVVMVLGSLWIVYSQRHSSGKVLVGVKKVPVQDPVEIQPPPHYDPGQLLPQPAPAGDELLRELWRKEIPMEGSDGVPVALGDNGIALPVGQDHVLGFDAFGRKRYDYNPPYFGYVGKLAACGEKDLIVTAGDTLVKLDEKGRELFNVDLKGSLLDFTPVVDHAGFTFVASAHNFLHKVSPEGELLWSCHLELGLMNVPPVPLADGSALVTSKYGDILRVDAQGSFVEDYRLGLGKFARFQTVEMDAGGQVRSIYICSESELLKLDSMCKVLWRYQLMGKPDCQPGIGSGGRVAVMNDDKELFCLSPGGDLVWRSRIPGANTLVRPLKRDNGGFAFQTDSRLFFISGEGKQEGEARIDGAAVAQCGNGILAIYPLRDAEQKLQLVKVKMRGA